MYLTFTPSKGSTVILKLVKCLAIVIDVFLLLLMLWTIANMCYPFWGWIVYAFTWVGLVAGVSLTWLIDRCSLRAFTVAKFQPTDKAQYFGRHDLKYLGFLFSVWEAPDALFLAYYHSEDRVRCLRSRYIELHCAKKYKTWLGWLIVLSTDAAPLMAMAALLCSGYFLGIGTVGFFTMGFVMSGQIMTFLLQSMPPDLWKDKIFLDGKLCTRKLSGVQMCVLEGPEGELFLMHYLIALFHHDLKSMWYDRATILPCQCCQLLLDPILLDCRDYFQKFKHQFKC